MPSVHIQLTEEILDKIKEIAKERGLKHTVLLQVIIGEYVHEIYKEKETS